ncbi:MAG: hypothetical protein JW815_00995 [Candidatus Bathyarchaeota archaeon]|nr:hypothetical protein [Candidatus Bathyarchaeum sp.]
MNGSGESIIQTSDGGYAIAGQSDAKSVLIKTNSMGDVEWTRIYNEGGQPYRALSMIQTTDGGYALGCISRSGFNFFKTDSAGNMEWSKGFFYGSNDVIEFRSVIQTRDGGYFLTGGCIPGNSGFVVKTDEDGNMQWNRTFFEPTRTFLTCAAETDDGYLLGGSYLIKVDSTGDLQWFKSMTVRSILRSRDGDYVLVGSNLGRLVKIDAQGKTVWRNSNGGDYATDSGAVANDGGYIFCCNLASSPIMATEYWGYVVKADSNGKMEWEMEYSKNSLINSVLASSDGSYVFTGVNPYDLSGGNDGLWFVKLDPTEIPEFNSLTILPFLIMATLIGIIIRNRIRKKCLD